MYIIGISERGYDSCLSNISWTIHAQDSLQIWASGYLEQEYDYYNLKKKNQICIR